MPIRPEALAQLASDYIKPMTSIRGRRIERLIKREFAGADQVTIVTDSEDRPTVFGTSRTGAAICSRNGKGPSASVIKWRHGETEGVETRYDLLKDSLPSLSSIPVRLSAVCLPRGMESRDIRRARFPEDLADVVSIFREYVASPTVDLRFQEYESEFASLPGKYAEPDGRILLAVLHGAVTGCAALRRVDQDICELKRVYVRPAARGLNLGRRLVESMIHEARNAGYTSMCLDVLPEFDAAQQLYRSLGFLPAKAVSYNPVPGTKFLALDLVTF